MSFDFLNYFLQVGGTNQLSNPILDIAAIVISAFVAIMLLVQVVLYRRDHVLRQRPWLAFYRPSNTEEVAFDEKTDPDSFMIHFINTGPVPAFDLEQYIFHSVTKPAEHVGEKDFWTQIGHIKDVAPNEIWTFRLARESGDRYFGFRFKYNGLRKNEGYVYEYRFEVVNGIRQSSYVHKMN